MWSKAYRERKPEENDEVLLDYEYYEAHPDVNFPPEYYERKEQKKTDDQMKKLIEAVDNYDLKAETYESNLHDAQMMLGLEYGIEFKDNIPIPAHKHELPNEIKEQHERMHRELQSLKKQIEEAERKRKKELKEKKILE